MDPTTPSAKAPTTPQTPIASPHDAADSPQQSPGWKHLALVTLVLLIKNYVGMGLWYLFNYLGKAHPNKNFIKNPEYISLYWQL
jgi:hypothetical protein